jgi:phage shock protein PspC (stress-responsive transcriptional regulator)
MKKTFTANISGIVFHIDEDAYEKLNAYLSNIRSRFESDAAGDEILADIESRIAEMFQARISGNKKVITIEDVNEVMAQLGEPEIIGEAGSDDNGPSPGPGAGNKGPKRLYRDPDDKYIAGVCGGIAAYFGFDPTWVRIAFVIFAFMYFGIPLYIVLWIVVPRAMTTAEKLEMRGEKVNLSNIEKSIREDINELKANIEEITEETRKKIKKKVKDKKRNESISMGLAEMFAVFGRVVGILLIIFAIFFLFNVFGNFQFIPHVINKFFIWTQNALRLLITAIVEPGLTETFTIIALSALIGIPLLMMIVTGIRLIFGIKGKIKPLGAIAGFLWFLGLVLLSVIIIVSARNYSSLQKSTQETSLEMSEWPVIYIDLDNSLHVDLYRDTWVDYRLASLNSFWKDEGSYARGIPSLTISHEKPEKFAMHLSKEARGINNPEAQDNAENIKWNFNQVDSLIILDPYFFFDKKSGWRNQKVKAELFIPFGKQVEIGPAVKRVMEVKRIHVPEK